MEEEESPTVLKAPGLEEQESPTVLKAPGFCDKAFSILFTLQKSQQQCDLVLQVTDGEVKVHSLVVVSSSSYFRQWFLDQTNKTGLTFIMPDVSMEELQDFVEFFYTGSLRLTSGIIHRQMALYEKFKVDEAVKLCKLFIEGVRSNFVSQDVSLSLSEGLDNSKPHDGDTQLNQSGYDCEMKTSEELSKSQADSVCAVKEEDDAGIDIESAASFKTEGTFCSKCKKKMSSRRRKSTKPRKAFTVLKMEAENNGRKKAKIKVESDSVFSDSTTGVVPDQKADCDDQDEPDDSQTVEQSDSLEYLDHSTSVTESNTSDTVSPRPTTRSLRKRSLLVRPKDYSQLEEDPGKKETVYSSEVKSYIRTTRVRGSKGFGKKRVNRHLYSCDICQYKSKSMRDIDGHKHSKHDIAFDNTKYTVYRCQVESCNFETLEPARLDKHMAYRHSDERPYVCEFCARAFKTLPELKLHLNLHLNDKLQCKECGKKFVSPSGLKKHVEEKHLGIKNENMCHLCAYRTTTGLNTLTQHMYTKHSIPLPTNFKVFKCEKCDFETFRARVFTSHQNMHTGTRDWQCDICQKKYTTEHNLKCHKLWHDEKKFICTYDGCSYSAIQKSRLQEHIKRMHTEKDVKPYSCHLCPHKSKIAGNLDKHLRSVHNLHIPDKRKYSHLYNLGRNLSHLEETPYGTDQDRERDGTHQQADEDRPYGSEADSMLQGESTVAEPETLTPSSMDLSRKHPVTEHVVGGGLDKDKDTMFTNMANANPAFLLEAYQSAMARAGHVTGPPHGMPVFPMPQPYRSAEAVPSMPYVMQDQSYAGQSTDSYTLQDSINYSMDSYR
ncbi:telomere zinc finger-associated protein-like [Gigantopelta aegis]|uniref:telomere zinc finger-associated protein-like n=1 Tax=Gigantopelta aegis TaxID=1735272 RepID=UPI001B88C939|nr:telomere zinc finger-associated protein-like [Gigantopelta aegis]